MKKIYDLINVVTNLNEDLYEAGLDEEYVLSIRTCGFAWIVDFNGLQLLDSETLDEEAGDLYSQILNQLVILGNNVLSSVAKVHNKQSV